MYLEKKIHDPNLDPPKNISIITSATKAPALANVSSPTKSNPIRTAKETPESDILNYWRSIEFFSPQRIPKTAPRLRQDPVFEIHQNEPLCPWEDSHPFKTKKHQYKLIHQHMVYCALYPHLLIKESLQAVFGQDEDSFDERMEGEGCVFAFSVSSEGRPLFDSFILSTSAWALGQILNNKMKKSNWLDGFDKCAKKLSLEFATYCKIDEEGINLKSQGHNVGKPLNGSDLFDVTNRLLKKLKLHLDGKIQIRVKSSFVSLSKAYKADDQDFLNSFFVEDLKKVSKACIHGELGRALKDFLSSNSTVDLQKKINVRKEIPFVFDTLAPQHFPNGRWPSVGHHPLVLSQQFAINSIFSTLKQDDSGIFAVNGPPGTGKTTLLRDLIAGVVVNRAICLAEYKDPKHILSGTKINWKTEKYTLAISSWSKEFENFSIVVASSNNGAVENITTEIPGEAAIDLSWGSYVDYFRELSANLIQKPAWALVAARLGNKANRNNFIQKFWYGELLDDNSDEALLANRAPSFLQLLKEHADSDFPQQNWQDALTSFKKAQQDEEKIRNERIGWYTLLNKINALKKDRGDLLQRIGREVEILKGIEQEYSVKNELYLSSQVQLDKINQKRLEHHQFRPKFIDIIFTLGKAYKIWSIKDNLYLEAIQNEEKSICLLEKKLEIISKNLVNCQKNNSSLNDEIHMVETKLNEAMSMFNILVQRYPTIPDINEWILNDTEKELSSPWADDAWNKARSILFLEALNLHKSFILSNALLFRKNMRAMMDILGGTVPQDAPEAGVKAAWLTFFFVIPVVSTTFASFDRLFKHLGKEDIGWLLIDEAGQATPQSAVGAIWRSKKVVVVGDPLQLAPIVTLPLTAQQSLRQYFQVSESWIPKWTSVQMLADRVTTVGTFLPYNDNLLWVGSPLRVHRRCDNPMFNIVNKIAYDELMVFGTPVGATLSLPDACWFNVSSQNAEGHFIPDEGKQLHVLLDNIIQYGFDPKNIFVISPFKQVVNELYKYQALYPNLNIGTIHTTQGKEADIVILVLGGEPKRSGAKQWASESPNLLNVAVSRAKRRLYVIGDRSSWKNFNYFDTMAHNLATSNGNDATSWIGSSKNHEKII
ncbi:MAG: ATP-binding protein [Legionella sp.]|nr:ATP-binding protein [Legionella sp.]